MNLTIDIGNTRIKIDIFHNNRSLVNMVATRIDAALIDHLSSLYPIDCAIVSSVRGHDARLLELLRSKIN